MDIGPIVPSRVVRVFVEEGDSVSPGDTLATLTQATGSFAAGLLLAIPATAALGMALEVTLLRTLYARDHLSQVLATFALILILNEAVRIGFGKNANTASHNPYPPKNAQPNGPVIACDPNATSRAICPMRSKSMMRG